MKDRCENCTPSTCVGYVRSVSRVNIGRNITFTFKKRVERGDLRSARLEKTKESKASGRSVNPGEISRCEWTLDFVKKHEDISPLLDSSKFKYKESYKRNRSLKNLDREIKKPMEDTHRKHSDRPSTSEYVNLFANSI